ncbi:MAG: hypothetical protein CTY33_04875 [Methylotenera sp.]|nr:MAG: hypothetical protein CTY33_04875 [Methylotenera sp.]
METLLKNFSLEPFDLNLRHYTRHKYDVKEADYLTSYIKLDRTDKSEVLWFINTFINQNSLFLNLNPNNYVTTGQKVERMLTQAPDFESNEAINDWVIKNWRSYN